jgi:hypothetical protein
MSPRNSHPGGWLDEAAPETEACDTLLSLSTTTALVRELVSARYTLPE